MSRKYTKMNYDEMVGRTYRNLTVLRFEITPKSIGSERRAICKCNLCGREDYDIRARWLIESHTGSCGCDKSYFESQRGKNSKYYKGVGDVSSHYISNITRRVKKRGLPCEIDAAYMWDLFLKQERKCALSGIEISCTNNTGVRSSGTASIDRIDSKKGYTKDNVQWVHKDINLMKMYLEEERFLELCRAVTLQSDFRAKYLHKT